jgi:hypothetical protein
LQHRRMLLSLERLQQQFEDIYERHTRLGKFEQVLLVVSNGRALFQEAREFR